MCLWNEYGKRKTGGGSLAVGVDGCEMRSY